jgi:hypothetical protein
MYSEQTYSTAPTGWSPIQALAGAQPYEWYVTFKILFSCIIQGTNHSALRRLEPK